MKKTLLFLFTITFFLTGSVYSQVITANNYYFYGGATGQFIGIVPINLIGANSDNVASPVTNIGFTFWLGGTPYTQFSVTEDGLMKLGSTKIVSEPVNNMASTLNLPKIAAYWDDLSTGPTGHVDYYLGGTSPARYLIVQWTVILKNIVGTPAAVFQARLYEGSGNIFIKSNAVIAANSGGYSMGIGVSGTDFASVTIASSSSASAAYGVANNNNTAGNNRQMQFTTDITAPTINNNVAISIPNIPGTANRTLTTVIADQAGTPISGIPIPPSLNVPRIYFKKNVSGAWYSTPGVLNSGNGTTGTWTFTVDHSLLGGVLGGDQVYYYVIAQDNGDYKGSPNIQSSPTGVIATNVNTVTTPPITASYYTIPASFSGTKTVGTGGDFASLTLVGGLFDQMNSGSVTGNLTVNIISDLTSETGAIGLNAWANGTSGPFTVTIHPVGNRIVSGVTVNGGNGSVIPLNGVTGFTIDGLNDGINSLTFAQTGQYYIGSVIDLKGASNNTIKNTTINGYGAGNYAITITNSNTVASNNNTISYCNITNPVISATIAGNGIGLLGAATPAGDHNILTHNTISNFVYLDIDISGKFSNTEISGNEIYNSLATSLGQNFKGINIGSGETGISNVFNNKIHDLLLTSASGSIPVIYTNDATGTTTNIYNNVIYLDASITHPLETWYGIQTLGAGAVNIDYNAIYIGGVNVTSGNSAGIRKDGTGTTNFRNNIVFNARSGAGKHYAIYNSTGVIASNYNDLYVNGTGGTVGFNVADRLTLADWQVATSNDANSISVDPQFTSSTNLLPLNTALIAGTPIAGITTDYIGILRNVTTPTMGAYEVAAPITYTISGNAGIAGVTLSWMDVTPKTVIADGSGAYAIMVSYNWTGTVTPSLTGYTFSPTNLGYANVLANQLSQNYTALPITYTISGNAGIAGATLSWMDGTAKTAIADGTGAYTFIVSYNWTGTVTPSLIGYTFSPINLGYTNVIADQLSQNYTATPITYTISGNAGNAGVTLSWMDGIAKTATSDGTGAYTVIVSYNWSGTVTPSLTGYTFSPTNLGYANVLANQTAQNYVATPFILANIKVFLEGPFDLGTAQMKTSLNTTPQIIPLSQPYNNGTTWSYAGSESVTIIPAGVVDWVFVELRQADDPASATSTTIFATRAAFLKSDGTIVDLDGTSPVLFSNAVLTPGNNLYVVIRHRNHLAIMSDTGATLTSGTYNYDFTSALTQAYGGGSGYKQVGTTFAMVAGDIDQDGNIFVTDYNAWAIGFGSTTGYFNLDLNMDGNVFVTDYNMWAVNFGSTIIPGLKSAQTRSKYFSAVPQ